MENNIKTDEILNNLKEFQKATVYKVVELLTNNNRVLVADEVGLGKTLIAKGVIAKLVSEKTDINPFKVVYICSNATIAAQNLKKLSIGENTDIDNASTSRLSMQHLKIYEQKNNSQIQLISLTPATSFNITGSSSGGIVEERALIYALLCKLKVKGIGKLRSNFQMKAKKNWDNKISEYEERISKINEKEYVTEISKKITDEIKEKITKFSNNKNNKDNKEFSKIIGELRYLFASISIEMLNPDLVIMDEFQRFKDLIDFNNDTEKSEMQMLAKKFLCNNNSNNSNNTNNTNNTKVLLLSATPYKLYSTNEENNSSDQDNHYNEFINVINFLSNSSGDNKINNLINDYSNSFLDNIESNNIQKNKKELEKYLLKYICRTERIFALNNNSAIIKHRRETLEVNEKDIKSYIQLQNLLNTAEIAEYAPIEFIKSAPYILSFMTDYKLKDKIINNIEENKEIKKYINKSDLLFINKDSISKYKTFEYTNAKFNYLLKEVFQKDEEKLLWVPPSKPYYKPSGVFENKENFSKILIFSKWVFVPRMITTLITYEAERRVLQSLPKTYKNDKKDKNLLTLFFKYQLNRNETYKFYNNIIKPQIKESSYKKILLLGYDENNKECYDENNEEYCKEYVKVLDNILSLYNPYDNLENLENLDDIKISIANNCNLNEYEKIFDNVEGLSEDKKPEYIALLSIASPMVVAYRTICRYSEDIKQNKIIKQAKEIAKAFINMFSAKHIYAVIEAAISNKDSGQYFFEKLLLYCAQGNLQAVFDEYAHLITSGNKIKNEDDLYKFATLFEEALNLPSAHYNVDTKNSFSNSSKPFPMRSHYAVSFLKGTGGNEKNNEKRRESLIHSFNSPFRPFILTSTSIAQEGLDFHQYCRKIVHWNLPHNPIDIEQREGRINRFKNYAIRKNIANKYGNIKDIEDNADIWNIMFQKAYKDLNKEDKSGLVPYWILPENFLNNQDDDKNIYIESIIPEYPFSKDSLIYNKLMHILSYYRLSLGQVGQEEFLKKINYHLGSDINLKELFINLSPYFNCNYKNN